jgi:hypothetical protein
VSGYLRSLAAQALGLGVPVKSAARLPYAAVPALFEQPAGDEASSSPAAARVSTVAPSMNAADPPGLPEAERPHAVSSLPFPRRDYAAVPTIFEQPSGDEATSPPTAAQVSSVAPSLNAGDELRLAHAMREPADRNPAAPSMTQPTVFGPAELVEPARVLAPPPLVPPTTRFVAPPAFAPVSPRSARTAIAHRHSTDSDATEVHVSIGRIEVTAVHEASPPPRRAVPAKKSMPLNEYLAQRQRGRR